jgi:hypothetical protein
MRECAHRLSSILARLESAGDQPDRLDGFLNTITGTVGRATLASDCKSLLAVCGQVAYRKTLAQLQSVFQRDKSDSTAETMMEATDNVMLAFLLWRDMQKDMFAHARTLTSMPTQDAKTVMEALSKLKTQPAKAICALGAHMAAYRKRHEAEASLKYLPGQEKRLRDTIPPALR